VERGFKLAQRSTQCDAYKKSSSAPLLTVVFFLSSLTFHSVAKDDIPFEILERLTRGVLESRLVSESDKRRIQEKKADEDHCIGASPKKPSPIPLAARAASSFPPTTN